jgi:transposase InsO family protein
VLWHIDVSYINLCGTFYYLCSILDGFSHFLVHWDLRESMREADVEVILERAQEEYPYVPFESQWLILCLIQPTPGKACSLQTTHQIGHSADGVPDNPRLVIRDHA